MLMKELPPVFNDFSCLLPGLLNALLSLRLFLPEQLQSVGNLAHIVLRFLPQVNRLLKLLINSI